MSSPTMRLVEVRSVSNLLFTFFVPMLARTGRGVTVESFLGPVDVVPFGQCRGPSAADGRRVVTVHDLTCLHFPQFHPWTRRTLFRLGIRRAARLADAIIVPSSATKSDLVARFPATEPKIHVIPEAHGEQFLPSALPRPRTSSAGTDCATATTCSSPGTSSPARTCSLSSKPTTGCGGGACAPLPSRDRWRRGLEEPADPSCRRGLTVRRGHPLSRPRDGRGAAGPHERRARVRVPIAL